MNISPIAVRASSAELSSARSNPIKAYKDIVATAGQQVKADEIALSPKAIKLLHTKPTDMKSADIAKDRPPVLWAPKDLPTINATGVKIDGPVKELGDITKTEKPPVLWAPKEPKVSTSGTKIDAGDVTKADDVKVDTPPPRSRREIWLDGWRNLGAATKRLMELTEQAKAPGLSTADRAKLNEEFKSIVANLNSHAESLIKEQGLTGYEAQVWRNSIGSRELFIDGNDNLLTAEGVQTLSEKLNKRSEVVFRTMQYLGV